MKTLSLSLLALMITGCAANPYAWDPLLNGALIQDQRKIATPLPKHTVEIWEYSNLGTPTGKRWRAVTK